MAVAASVLMQARDSNAEVMASFYRRAGALQTVSVGRALVSGLVVPMLMSGG
jgi:hypothetical protein